jgi:hypothetical protein
MMGTSNTRQTCAYALNITWDTQSVSRGKSTAEDPMIAQSELIENTYAGKREEATVSGLSD